MIRPCDILVQIAILSSLGALWFQFDGLEYPANVFPGVLLVVVALLSLACLIKDAVARRGAEHSGPRFPSRDSVLRIFTIVTTFAVYIVMYPKLGFYAATAVFLVLVVFILQRGEKAGGRAPSRRILVASTFAVFFTLALYLCFALMLRVPAPTGLLL